jgi:hypothetical protein
MLKSIMEDQNNNTPPPTAPNTNPQDPPVVVSQPAQPIAPTAPATPAAPPPQVSVVTSSPSTGQPNTAPPNAAPTGPLTEWPGAFKIYKISKAAVMLNLGVIIGLIAITFGAAIVYFILVAVTKATILELPYDLVNIMLTGALLYGLLQSAKGNKVSIGQAYSAVVKKWINLIIVSIMMVVILGISIILFVIPFFFVWPRHFCTFLNVLDQDMGPVQALQASWEQTKGNSGKIYGILGVSLLIILPSITIIGILATIYLGLMYYASSAILYLYLINKHSGGSASPSIAQPPVTPGVAPTPAAS